MQINTTQPINGNDLSVSAKLGARMAGVHYQTILRHIRRGNLKATKAAGYMIRPEDVRQFINDLPELSRVGPRRAAKRMKAKV